MADSLFFKHHLLGGTKVSFLLLEYLNLIVMGDDAQQVTMASAITRAFEETYKASPTEADVDNIVERLVKRQQDAEDRKVYDTELEQEKSERPKSAKKHWGDNLNDWALDRDAAQVCMYVAEYDAREARYLYCEEDSDYVFELAKARYARDYEFARAGFEAAVYGAGGSFNSDKETVIDLEKGGEAAEAELAKFFGKGGF